MERSPHRYEVRAKFEVGDEEHVVGQTNDPSGGRVLRDLREHPNFHSPRVVERENEVVD